MQASATAHRPNRLGARRRAGWLAAVVISVVSLLGAAAPALAVSGSSSMGNAAVTQYVKAGGGRGVMLGAGKTGGNSPQNPSGGGTNGTSPNSTLAATSATSGDTGSSLPFTGYAILTVVGVGLCLLSVGAVIRRRARIQPSA